MEVIRARFKKTSIDLHERVCVLGRTRTGKSFFTSLLLESFAKKTLVILLDTKDEYTHIKPVPLNRLMSLKKGLFRINEIIYPNGKKIDDLRIICEFLSQNMFKRGKCILCVEEAGNVVKKSGMLYENMPYFAKMLLQGGGKDIGIVIVSQRPAQIHTDCLNEAEHIICFDLSGKHDYEAIKNWFPTEWFEKLGKHEFFHYNIKEKDKMHCYRLYPSKEKINQLKKLFGKA